jgi:hypothetical protein
MCITGEFTPTEEEVLAKHAVWLLKYVIEDQQLATQYVPLAALGVIFL